jgi:hypothetical protein
MSETPFTETQQRDRAATAWPHTRVRSVRGPEWCCQQCSLSAGRYVEWPCAGTQLLVFAVLGHGPVHPDDASLGPA